MDSITSRGIIFIVMNMWSIGTLLVQGHARTVAASVTTVWFLFFIGLFFWELRGKKNGK